MMCGDSADDVYDDSVRIYIQLYPYTEILMTVDENGHNANKG